MRSRNMGDDGHSHGQGPQQSPGLPGIDVLELSLSLYHLILRMRRKNGSLEIQQMNTRES